MSAPKKVKNLLEADFTLYIRGKVIKPIFSFKASHSKRGVWNEEGTPNSGFFEKEIETSCCCQAPFKEVPGFMFGTIYKICTKCGL